VQLKKLQLLGFKTFADKTEIVLDTGLTAIVGPNGSGKSNLVDALLWVLGEQNPRLLRGNNAQDVIFAGTDKRKPLGMAEVKLTVDNSDGTLPINFSEVTVTRRIYRSGESQYLLNGAACRLKDIVELFMDTGVGKGAYSFVSQSEIDAVLSARAEDRRELFEEAAGIKKYRVKKREALRKLESAETNLNRVRDILHELEGQREPMEQQALAARRFLGLQERLHEIEVGLLVSELKKADYELYAGRQEREDDGTKLLAVEADLARLERLAEEVGGRLAQAEGEMEAVRVNQQNALSTVERTESRLTLMTERGKTAARTQEQLVAELKDLAERIDRLTDSIAIDREDRDKAEADEAGRRHEWAAQKAALVELETAVSAALREIETRQSERLRLAQERAGREAALKAAEDRLRDTTVRAERLAAEAAALAESLLEAQTRRRQAAEARDAQTAQRAKLAEARGGVEAQAREAQTEQQRTRAGLEVARRQQAEQSSRLATLTEMQENHEGFYQGVRAVLNAVRQNQLRGHYQAVVDLLTVPERYRVAIEVALGGSLQDVVTETEAEAKAGIEWLKRNRAGRATFLPLPLLRPGQRFDLRQLRDLQGVEGVAEDLIEYAAQYGPVAQLLLGRVLVVTDMDAGIAASRRLSGWSKIVTLEGELLTPGGALTGGSLQGRGVHLVGRKGEMDDLKAGLPTTRAEVERLAAQAEALTRRLQELEAERNRLNREESALAAQLAATESAIGAADRECSRMEQERANRANAQQTLSTQIAALEAERQKLTDLLATGREQNDSADDALASLNDETRALIARRDECRGRAVALEVEVSRLREKREGLTRALATDRVTLTSLQQQRDMKAGQRSNATTEGAEAEAERERLLAQRETAREHLTKVEVEFAQWRDRRQALLAESFANNNATKAAMERRAAITKNLHETELRLARLEVQITQAAERLRDEYNIDRETALVRPDDVAVDKNTAIEVGRLRRELRGMGQVNTGAVAEYERLTERYDYLTAQRADLDKGRESLLATIAEIDESTRGVFMETFEAVRVEFDRLFTRLFEGGNTKLVLTNPDDLLETGIEVIAQPPGKKPQSLSLLSGGERALTATALLFAFLAVKPSPFVLLDEVDAPLDGANVEKYTRLVHEFSQRSQFLLITHNPVTMEAAPTWYGVTMKEPGISSVLSYRVPQESILSETEAAIVLTK
jgi:chromosome segregation protein